MARKCKKYEDMTLDELIKSEVDRTYYRRINRGDVTDDKHW